MLTGDHPSTARAIAREAGLLIAGQDDVVRAADTVSRLGGDEFAIFLPDVRSRQDVEVIARKVLDELRRPFFLDEQECYISCSMGIAHYPQDGTTPVSLLRRADMAMYHVKAEGKNGFAHFA